MRGCLRIAVAFAVVGLVASPADAWWRTGHERITEGAVSHLPPSLHGFFEDNLADVMTYSGDEPSRPPQHYIDIDLYPGWPGVPIIRDQASARAAHGDTLVDNAGTAPWAVDDRTAELSAQMAAAASEQDWQDLLVTAGELAHYIEDLHNPLHLTVNYNGQLSGNNGIHARYEGGMVYGFIDQLTIAPTPSACQYSAPIIDTIFDSIEGVGGPGNYQYVADIMIADDAAHAVDPDENVAYFVKLWEETDDFTKTLFQEGSQMVASAWYTAWIDAGSPTPIPEPATIGVLFCGGLWLVTRRHRR
ncbi:MAG: PEP-CTERM sorting domain-containing protein [bacterium]|nr:PEP-CTERM sorting domain-containing protein [bacterium]